MKDKPNLGYPNIVVLTGAGVSAESGLATFRDQDGLWNNYRIEEVATLEAFLTNQEVVQNFYNMRRNELKNVKPNDAHKALAKLEKEWPGDFLLVTQNVDDLHQRAGSKNIIQMHGELGKARCFKTGTVYEWEDDITESSRCECCNEFGTLRPHIVWFGEMPLGLDEIYAALNTSDIFISIGTSGNVYPAAGFAHTARENGCQYLVEINLEPSETESFFDEKIYGLAGEEVPKFVDRLLKEGSDILEETS